MNPIAWAWILISGAIAAICFAQIMGIGDDVLVLAISAVMIAAGTLILIIDDLE